MAYIRLHVQQADGHLPMVCMRCGAPATAVADKKLSWYPRWIVVILVVLCGLPGIILALVLYFALRKTARIQAPFCEAHRRHWTTRLIVNWVTGILGVGLSVAGIAAFIALNNMRPRVANADGLEPLLCIGSSVVFVAWLVILAIMNNTSIRPDEITGTHMLLRGVSEAFVDAVEEAEIERRVRLRQWQEEDAAERPHRVAADDLDDLDAAPPKRTSSDAIEEDRARRTRPSDAIEE